MREVQELDQLTGGYGWACTRRGGEPLPSSFCVGCIKHIPGKERSPTPVTCPGLFPAPSDKILCLMVFWEASVGGKEKRWECGEIAPDQKTLGTWKLNLFFRFPSLLVGCTCPPLSGQSRSPTPLLLFRRLLGAAPIQCRGWAISALILAKT